MRLLPTDANESKTLAHLALGRLFRIMRRPYQDGDMEQYHQLRAILLNTSPEPADHQPNYARDRYNGAQGD